MRNTDATAYSACLPLLDPSELKHSAGESWNVTIKQNFLIIFAQWNSFHDDSNDIKKSSTMKNVDTHFLNQDRSIVVSYGQFYQKITFFFVIFSWVRGIKTIMEERWVVRVLNRNTWLYCLIIVFLPHIWKNITKIKKKVMSERATYLQFRVYKQSKLGISVALMKISGPNLS